MEQGGIFSYNEDYNRKMRERIAQDRQEAQTQEAADKTTSEKEINGGVMQQGGQMAQQGAKDGNAAGALGGGLMAAGAIPSPASPYLMAAGLGLNVIRAGEQNKRDQEEAQRKDYNARIKQRQTAMSQIAQMGIQ